MENYEIEILEDKWRENKERISFMGWIGIFPEAKPYLRHRQKELKERAFELMTDIEGDLKKISKIEDNFSRWFWKEKIKVFKGEELDKLIREIKKISWGLKPKTTRTGITDKMIDLARNFPIESLIKTKRHFTICPFHKEKSASFYTKNNFGFCFGCGWSGGSIDLLMERDGLSFKEAVKRLVSY